MKKVIYTLSDPRDINNIRYIGITKNTLERRLIQHISDAKCRINCNRHLFNFIRNILKNELIPHIEFLEEVSESDCENFEIYYIYQFRAWGFDLVNTSEGGRMGGVKKHTLETKEKIKESLRNKSKEWHEMRLEKIKLSRTGFKHTEESKKKISKNNKKPMLGKHPSAETRKKMSLAQKEKKISEKTLERLKTMNIGRKMSKSSSEKRWATLRKNGYSVSEETKKRLSDSSEKRRKAVLQYDMNKNLINIHLSIRDASRNTNINKSSISQSCNKKVKFSSGFIWRFEDDKNPWEIPLKG